MGMDLGKKTFSTETEYFVAGTYPITKAVKTAAEELPAHTPVILSGGKVSALTAPERDGAVDTTGIYGITADSAEANEDAVLYLTGEFFADSLALPEGVKAADIETALRNIGIFLK